MKTAIAFMRHLVRMPMPWPVWVAILGLTNLAAVFFLPSAEAWVVLAALAFGFAAQSAIFARKGFVRLLGLGHLHWIPMLIWLYSRPGPSSGWLLEWTVAVIAVNGVSVVIDVIDVVRYALGDREPQVVLGPAV